MPELDETEWDKIINNVSLISFMQGLPLKNKYYMGYSIVTNTKSKEFVDPDEIYLLTGNNPQTYHKVIWKGFDKNSNPNGTAIPNGPSYRNVDFERKTYKKTTDDGDIELYYYPHGGASKLVTGDYESIVSPTNVYSYDDEKDSLQRAMENINNDAKKSYYTALYRERYINYKSLVFNN